MKVFTAKEFHEKFETSNSVSISGEIVNITKMAKACLITISDSTGAVECFVNRENVNIDNYKKLTIGDNLIVEGDMSYWKKSKRVNVKDITFIKED